MRKQYYLMEEDKNELTPEEKIRQENDLLKLKMMAEQGAKFFEGSETELSPTIENQWLNYIQNFEELHKNAKKISVYKLIGEPAFEAEEDLDDASITNKLNELLEYMGEHGVCLDYMDGYDDRVIYKFIVDELFSYEMDDVRMDGMVSHFIYEEFYPNHNHDLTQHTEEFIYQLLKSEWNEFASHTLCKELRQNGQAKVSEETFVEKIKLFQAAWKNFEVTKEEIISVDFSLEKGKASVLIDLAYSAFSHDGEEVPFAGNASLGFAHQYGYWYIDQVSFPGFFE
jgi:hypothetical protein